MYHVYGGYGQPVTLKKAEDINIMSGTSDDPSNCENKRSFEGFTNIMGKNLWRLNMSLFETWCGLPFKHVLKG